MGHIDKKARDLIGHKLTMWDGNDPEGLKDFLDKQTKQDLEAVWSEYETRLSRKQKRPLLDILSDKVPWGPWDWHLKKLAPWWLKLLRRFRKMWREWREEIKGDGPTGKIFRGILIGSVSGAFAYVVGGLILKWATGTLCGGPPG